MARGLLASVLGVVLLVATRRIAVAARIGNCPAARFVPNLSSAVGLPFEDASSPGGTLLVGDGVITRRACPAVAAPFTVSRHRRRLHARWDRCGSFTRVRLRLGPGPGGQCDYVVGVIHFRDASGRPRGVKLPADRVAPGWPRTAHLATPLDATPCR